MPGWDDPVQPAQSAPSWDDPIGPATHRATSHVAPIHRAVPTARPVATPDVPEPSWSQALSEGAQNLVPSAKATGASLLDAIVHPQQTISNLGQLGAGVASKVAGAVGIQQDQAQKAKTEALANAVFQHYAQSYGSQKGIKQAIAKDPVGVMMDVSTLFGGAGAGAKVAGLEKAASTLARASSAVDPVANAVRLAKAPGAALAAVPKVGKALQSATSPTKWLQGAQSVATGVPHTLIQTAADAGKTSDPALRQAFTKFYTGQGDATEILDRAQSALGAIKHDQSNAYLAGKAGLRGAPVDFSRTQAALSQARNDLSKGASTGWANAKQAVQSAQDMVDDIAGRTNPLDRNIEHADALKKQLWDLKDQFGDAQSGQQLDRIYHAVKADISAVDPTYAALMEKWQTGLNNVNDIRKTLIGGGNAPAATTAVTKMLRQLKTSTGENLFGQLAEKEPELIYQLAGHALNPWGASGKAGMVEAMLPWAAGATGYLAHNPVAAAAHLVGQAALQSPRIAGGLNYLAGAADRAGLVSNVARTAYLGHEGLPALAQNDGTELTDREFEGSDDAQDVWQRMIHQESRGRQTDSAGNVITSPKGALGIAQIMPGTGPEAAALAGEEWSPERLKIDPDYNEKLGRAYYQMLLGKFNDPILAAAAYNAGPGTVQQALQLEAESKLRGENHPWTDFLPQETRNYVRVVSSIPRASGGAVEDKIQPLLKRLLSMAKEAKRQETKATKPLLGASDDAVARALRIAGEKI